jgi:hypothetical protein
VISVMLPHNLSGSVSVRANRGSEGNFLTCSPRKVGEPSQPHCVFQATRRFGRNRRLAKDFENLANTLFAFVTIASVNLAVRRLTRSPSLSEREVINAARSQLLRLRALRPRVPQSDQETHADHSAGCRRVLPIGLRGRGRPSKLPQPE